MTRLSLLFTLVCALGITPVSAGVLYDNGPANGMITSWNITEQSVSDSFILASASSVTGVTLTSWQDSGNVLVTVDWVISLGNVVNGFGTVYGSGTATVTPGTALGLPYGFDGSWDVVAGNQFALPNLSLAAGTYYLTLGNASSSIRYSSIYWDENDGPSDAWQTFSGHLNGSHTFQILGETAAVPEPGSWLLLAGGLALAVIRRRAARE